LCAVRILWFCGRKEIEGGGKSSPVIYKWTRVQLPNVQRTFKQENSLSKRLSL
jgi:hypothetical protein